MVRKVGIGLVLWSMSWEVFRDDKEVEKEVISFFSNLYGPEVFPKLFVHGVDWSPISEKEQGVV